MSVRSVFESSKEELKRYLFMPISSFMFANGRKGNFLYFLPQKIFRAGKLLEKGGVIFTKIGKVPSRPEVLYLTAIQFPFSFADVCEFFSSEG